MCIRDSYPFQEAVAFTHTLLGAAVARARQPWTPVTERSPRPHLLLAEVYRRLRRGTLRGLPLGADQ
eukprot:9519125-Alexandrium_andersonii.AAC.1